MGHLFDIDDMPYRDVEIRDDEWIAFVEEEEEKERDRRIRHEDRHNPAKLERKEAA